MKSQERTAKWIRPRSSGSGSGGRRSRDAPRGTPNEEQSSNADQSQKSHTYPGSAAAGRRGREGAEHTNSTPHASNVRREAVGARQVRKAVQRRRRQQAWRTQERKRECNRGGRGNRPRLRRRGEKAGDADTDTDEFNVVHKASAKSGPTNTAWAQASTARGRGKTGEPAKPPARTKGGSTSNGWRGCKSFAL